MKVNSHYNEIRIVTWFSFLLNNGLVLVKLLFGYWAHSQVLIADGLHSLSDGLTDIAILFGSQYWSAPADEDHPHGHGRIEMLVTVFIGFLLGIAGVIIIIKAIKSVTTDIHTEMYSVSVIVIGLVSIVLKEFLYRITVCVGKRAQSSAVIANAWHHRSDALSSIPVVVAGIGTVINPTYYVLDPIGAVIVGVLIIYSSTHIIMPMLNQLVDRGVSKQQLDKLRSIAMSIEGVKDIHAFRSRYIGGGVSVDLHVLVEPTLSVAEGHIIAGKVKKALLDRGGEIVDVLIHIEPYEGNPNLTDKSS